PGTYCRQGVDVNLSDLIPVQLRCDLHQALDALGGDVGDHVDIEVERGEGASFRPLLDERTNPVLPVFLHSYLPTYLFLRNDRIIPVLLIAAERHVARRRQLFDEGSVQTKKLRLVEA